jgi:hypothetical protein
VVKYGFSLVFSMWSPDAEEDGVDYEAKLILESSGDF